MTSIPPVASSDPATPARGARFKTLFVVGVVIILIVSAWVQPLDSSASQKIDEGLTRALTTFAIARSANAVISVLQETQVSVSMVGGMTLAPGQILDPLNDLIEKFSTLLLTASVIFGALKVLLAISTHWTVSAFLSLVAIPLAYCLVRRITVPRWGSSLAMLVIIVRFAVPAVMVVSDAAFQEFLAADYAKNSLAISTESKQLETFGGATAKDASDDTGLGEKVRDWLSQTTDIGARLQRVKVLSEQFVDHVVSLCVIFLMQALLIPFVLFFAFSRLTKGFLGLTH